MFKRASDTDNKISYYRCQELAKAYDGLINVNAKDSKTALANMKGFVAIEPFEAKFELRISILGPPEYCPELLRLRVLGYVGDELTDQIEWHGIEGITLSDDNVTRCARYKKSCSDAETHGRAPTAYVVGREPDNAMLAAARQRVSVPSAKIIFESEDGLSSTCINVFI
jgi:hypothetical protein